MKRLAMIGLCLGLVLPAGAQPPASAVLEEAVPHQQGGCAWVDLRFAAPVGYLSHFPRDAGRQLRIDLQLLEPAAEVREALHPALPAPFHLSWVTLELAALGRGVLYIDFDHTTNFKVGQGRDFRSIVIAVPAGHDAQACAPDRLPPQHANGKAK